ncbi:MAG: class I SAM-dependent methyltransferase [Anaerolineales bacterium]
MLLLLPIVALVLLIVWELWICEGAHLGRRVVVWLYDLAAARYDGIKQFDVDWERQFLGEPLNKILSELPKARLLDVGAGTARTFRALNGNGLGQDSDGNDESPPAGLLVGVEPSGHMMELGREMAGPDHAWVQGWAVPLPIARESFDVAVCLEVLEFTPHPRQTIGEILRILRPGGWALLTNRIGWQAPLIFGRTVSRPRFPDLLRELGFETVEVFPWQVDYDIAWARKPWT